MVARDGALAALTMSLPPLGRIEGVLYVTKTWPSADAVKATGVDVRGVVPTLAEPPPVVCEKDK
jgi:hypothetical protein